MPNQFHVRSVEEAWRLVFDTAEHHQQLMRDDPQHALIHQIRRDVASNLALLLKHGPDYRTVKFPLLHTQTGRSV